MNMQEKVILQSQISVLQSSELGTRRKMENQLKSYDNKHKLTLLKGEIYRYLSSVMVFDDKNYILYNSRIVSENNLEISIDGPKMVFKLPSGNYTIRITVDGQFTDTLVKLDKDKICVIGKIEEWLRPNIIHYQIKPPQLFSSVPLDGSIHYSSTYDYYVEAATAISRIDTFKMDNSVANSGLFIFFRYPNADIFRKKFKSKACWSKFKLYNSQNEILTSFPDGTSAGKDYKLEYDESLGFLGFSAELPPGQYFIRYSGKDKRTIPVYVYENWYTQLFMMIEEEPLFGTLKVLLDKNRRFDSKNILHSYVDVCLSKLQNGDYTMDEELIDKVAYGKFDSPILGLLGAFIYLKSNQKKNDDRFKIIVRNLQREILSDSSSSQDIYALNFLSYDHFGKTLNDKVKRNVEGTPMFRVAYDVIRKAASIHDWVIPVNSLNDRVAENQYFDSPFNTYKTVIERRFKLAGNNLNKENEEHIKIMDHPDLGIFYNWQDLTRMKYESPLQVLLDKEEDSGYYISDKAELVKEFYVNNKNLLPSIFDEAKWDNSKDKEKKLQDLRNRPIAIGRVGLQIASFIFENSDVSNTDIARELNLPISTIKRIRRKLRM